MEDIRGARLRKFNLRKIILGVRMHFRHISRKQILTISKLTRFNNFQHLTTFNIQQLQHSTTFKIQL